MKVLVVRGHQANPWELRPWELLPSRFEVSYLATGSGWFSTSGVNLRSRRAPTMRDVLPAGRFGDLLVRLPGDRYLNPADAFAGFDVVHAQELGFWYSAQAAALKHELGFKLVLTVWETLPFMGVFRNVRTRPYREATLAGADLFLPCTERAGMALRVEGADAARIRVNPPGVDLHRFRASKPPRDLVVLSAGRLVWEKGHQDVLRALALVPEARAVIIGRGPEEERLRRYAVELGVASRVEFREFVPYEEMPEVYAGASCLVLASMPVVHWEEQFGMVLIEAMACGLPIVASSSGAIPEVAGEQAAYFAPGDWVGLADRLREIPRRRVFYEIAEYSVEAAAARLAAAYDSL
jgi:glycosyltransferase involved in cell wall biosynthesis